MSSKPPTKRFKQSTLSFGKKVKTSVGDLSQLPLAANSFEGFSVQSTPADGSCLFSSLAHQVGKTSSVIREELVVYLKAHYEEFVEDEDWDVLLKEAGGFQKYLDNMRLPSTWGDGTMIETAMRFYKRPIFIFSEFESQPCVISYPGITADAKPIFLGYTECSKGEGLNHYVSLIPIEGVKVVASSLNHTLNEIIKESANGASPQPQDISSGSSKFKQHSRKEPKSTAETTGEANDYADSNRYSHLPKQLCKTRVLAFQPHWIEKFQWIMIKPNVNGVLCQVCSSAHALHLMSDSVADRRLEDAFISVGMNNWQHALSRFRAHEKSNCHMFAFNQLQQYKRRPQVNVHLDQQTADQHKVAQKALNLITTSVLYLARQGLALRGHDSDEGNFKQLLRLRSSDVEEVDRWMNGRFKQYTSYAIQNELLELAAHQILRDLTSEIRNSQQFSLVVDGTTDVSCNEQECISIRYVDKHLRPQEVFVGFYNVTEGTDAHALVNMICDILLRLNLPIGMLRGQTYDGASNMAGKHNGVQALIARKQPLALYVHCLMHCGNLAAQSALESSVTVRDSTSLANELAVFSRQSTKLSGILKSVQLQHDSAASLLRPLCPTRVLCRGPALKLIINNLESIMDALEQYAGVSTAESAAKARVFATAIGNGNFIIGIKMAVVVLELFENLNRAVQSRHVSVSAMLDAMKITTGSIAKLRTDDMFRMIFEEVVAICDRLDVPHPKMPRQRRPPRRYTGPADSHEFPTTEDYFRNQFYEFIDVSVNSLQDRYEQPGLQRYVYLEQILLQPLPKDQTSVREIVERYPELDADRLMVQLAMMRQQDWQLSSVDAVAVKLASLEPPVRSMFNQVEQLARLLLTVPSSNAEAERSFSSLRRLKTYLRNSMRQDRLNHLALLHVHQDRVDSLNIEHIENDFVEKCASRRSTFGGFFGKLSLPR